MAYRETFTKGALTVDAEAYDVDLFGMDDGQNPDPDATFRFLFQLGQGFMIYRYVLCAMQPGDARWFHTFWTKDCAVFEVDEEEHGPPARVRATGMKLPRLYETFRLAAPGAPPRDFMVLSLTFEADFDGDAGPLGVRFELADPHDAPAALTWSVADRWQLEEGGVRRALEPPERVTFVEPF
jgi:hypothetical protein